MSSNSIPTLERICATAEDISQGVVAALTDQIDREARWPEESMRALADAGLWGLNVPREYGGLGQGMYAIARVSELLGKSCASTSLCFGMHCVGTAVIAAKATPYQVENYLRPIAAGRHLTTLALTETGSGVHLYLPSTSLKREDSRLIINGSKHFVTNGGFADSYVISTVSEETDLDIGQFSCVLLDQKTEGVVWEDIWEGFGMRGNASRSVRLEQVSVSEQNLLGEEGDQTWYIFEVVAPYFLIAMSGTYLGLAQAAIDLTIQHLKSRQYPTTGSAPSNAPVVQHRLGELWMAVASARQLIYHAAQLGDAGDPQALPALLSCKAVISDVVVRVANEAMTLCGGIAYRENARLARILRDARAAHVMSPTTDLLKLWTGRALLGQSLL